jgi:ComF family protein
MNMQVKPLLKDFFSLFFPNYCFGCRDALARGEDVLCTTCLSELPRLDNNGSDAIMARFEGRLNIAYAWALLKFQKAGIVQNLLHELKYNHHPEVGIKLGKVLGASIAKQVPPPFDIIVPVPLHSSRLRSRGYNQSGLIAQGLSEVLNAPWREGAIIRTAATQTQTKKSKLDRLENVRQSFQINLPELVKHKHVLLVDDVVTTGATLEACGEKILEAGAASLSLACVAEVQ